MKVSFQNVSKRFGAITALSDVSFDVSAGEFVLLVGPSGSGKSTILRLILAQFPPTSGQIFLDDLDLTTPHTKFDRIRRQIGVVYQDYQMIPDKTVDENIHLSLDIIGTSLGQRELITENVLDEVDLLSRRHLFPAQLSGGELQRACLARAIAVSPKLILADEPTGNLDPTNSWNLLRLLKKINKDHNTTIIMTTHNHDIINSLGLRQLEITMGQLTQSLPIETPKIVKKSKKKKSL